MHRRKQPPQPLKTMTDQELTFEELQSINGGLFGKTIFEWVACFVDKDHPYCPDNEKNKTGRNSVQETKDGKGCTDDLNSPF